MRSKFIATPEEQVTNALAVLHKSKEPILITEQGKPSAYLLSIADYEYMLRRAQILEGILKSEQDIQGNQVFSHATAKEKVSKWLK